MIGNTWQTQAITNVEEPVQGNGGQINKPSNPTGYCWTCEYKALIGHSNGSCSRKTEGHQVEATRWNTMGGSECIRQWKSE
eukprot:14186509-Ditylum_brightwellii.AAC.1